MTAINVELKARQLGVDLEDEDRGYRKIAKYLGEHKDVPIHQRTIDAIKSLPEKEMIAVIRMGSWDIKHPEIFTKDGLREKA